MNQAGDRETVRTSTEVSDALAEGRPVVALETAVVTHGLPSTTLATPACMQPNSPLPAHLAAPLSWDESLPANVQLGRLMQTAVRNAGAVPASIGVLDGTLHIGMNDEELDRLASSEDLLKASSRDLAAVIAGGRSAGTTVAASVHACTLARGGPIRTFATGGIGGVHRDWQKRPDISADLAALARQPVAVVASGAKVILDLMATIELLDALGVLILGHMTNAMPRFTASATSDIPIQHVTETPGEIARTCRIHWDHLQSNAAVLVANPCPRGLESNIDQLDRLVDAGLAEAATLGIEGGEVTPFLLDAIGRDPEANAISANLALLLANATLAAHIAIALVDEESTSA